MTEISHFSTSTLCAGTCGIYFKRLIQKMHFVPKAGVANYEPKDMLFNPQVYDI